MSSVRGCPRNGRERGRAAHVDAHSLTGRILRFIDCHATDPELRAGRVAAAHHISVRYLYIVLGREQIALGDYIRAQRLNRAAAMLRRPDHRDMAISAVAHACGFYDHAHFCRAFRAATGMTPSQWRRADAGEHRGEAGGCVRSA